MMERAGQHTLHICKKCDNHGEVNLCGRCTLLPFCSLRFICTPGAGVKICCSIPQVNSTELA